MCDAPVGHSSQIDAADFEVIEAKSAKAPKVLAENSDLFPCDEEPEVDFGAIIQETRNETGTLLIREGNDYDLKDLIYLRNTQIQAERPFQQRRVASKLQFEAVWAQARTAINHAEAAMAGTIHKGRSNTTINSIFIIYFQLEYDYERIADYPPAGLLACCEKFAEQTKTFNALFKGTNLLFMNKDTELPSGILFLKNDNGSNDVIIDNILVCKDKPAGEALYHFIMAAKVFKFNFTSQGLNSLLNM